MSQARTYLDFSIELRDLDRTVGSYTVAPLPSPELGELPPIPVNLKADELEGDLEDLRRKRIYLDELIHLGEQLTDRLLPAGPVRDGFGDAVRRVGRDGGVRLRVLTREPRLAQLPWEYAYLQIHEGEKNRNHFLVLNPQISLVRHVPLAEEHPSLAGADPRGLRLVAATANPTIPGANKLRLPRKNK